MKKLDYLKDIVPCRVILAKAFPKLFTLPKRGFKLPLKIGIFNDILKVFPEIDRELLKHTLGDYTSGPVYTRAMTAGAERYDLDGKASGIVTVEDEVYAHRREYQRIQRIRSCLGVKKGQNNEHKSHGREIQPEAPGTYH